MSPPLKVWWGCILCGVALRMSISKKCAIDAVLWGIKLSSAALKVDPEHLWVPMKKPDVIVLGKSIIKTVEDIDL